LGLNEYQRVSVQSLGFDPFEAKPWTKQYLLMKPSTMLIQTKRICTLQCAAILLACVATNCCAQSVLLPAPRLLTTKPMGAKQGTQVDIVISGENIEDAEELYFSDARLKATRKKDAEGRTMANQYSVEVAADCAVGVYETRVMTRLGISSSRVFSVGTLPEIAQKSPNTTLAAAMELQPNQVCNAAITAKSIDHYFFNAEKGKRYVVSCEAKGIDSKLEAVLILADAQGQDLIAERRGGMIDYVAKDSGKLVLKIHDLTFKGGADFFYRLTIHELSQSDPLPLPVSTKNVNAFSWPPLGIADKATLNERETNEPQSIDLPCDILGSFYPAADVDTFQFTAKKGDIWWIEVGSERLGLPTDPAILVQHVNGEGDQQKLTDVAQFSDIASPVKVSSNGYAYDGPPYDAGSSDVLGRLEIKEDGLYPLQISDLFGGTRNDSRNIYRLIIRKETPDFALVAWPLHMELRNGDRSAFSKPVALRGGTTMAFEVVVIRRDGFNGEIELVMEGLPEGVTAKGLSIAADKSRGIMLITAREDAPRSLSNARFFGRSRIADEVVTRPCRLAEFKWPVPDSWGEIPEPRLVSDVIVSVSGYEKTPFSMAAAEDKVWEVGEKEIIKIPLKHVRRSEFSGSTLQLRTFGQGFEQVPMFDVNLMADQSEVTLNLANLKTAPGDYLIAFYGSAVAKYRYCPESIDIAQIGLRKAEQDVANITVEVGKITEEIKAAAVEAQAALKAELETLTARQKAASDAVTAAMQQVKAAADRAQPRDIVDIVVSEPIAIRVKPSESK
jgi:hypothetical protein